MTELFDQTDLSLMRALQADATRSLEDLAADLSLSTNTCWRRVKRLEASGAIAKRVALIDADSVGLSQTVFVAVRTNDHSKEWLQAFARTVSAFPEVTELYRMAGDVDYLMKVTTRSVADYDRVYKALIEKVTLADVSATFAMECIKYTTELPI